MVGVALWKILGLLIAGIGSLLTLITWGFRRRAMTPACARCGYDVSHRPAGIERCSECGADLAASGGIATSRRRARPWVAIPATLVAVVALAWGGTAAVRFPYRWWIGEHAPLSWVEGLARRDPSVAGDAFRTAWKRRDSSAAFYDHLLDLQGDPTSTSWTGGRMTSGEVWLTFANGHLTQPQVERLSRQMCGPLTYRVRTPIHVGDPLVVRATGPAPPKNFNLMRRVTVAASAGGTAERGGRRGSPFGVPGDLVRRRDPCRAVVPRRDRARPAPRDRDGGAAAPRWGIVPAPPAAAGVPVSGVVDVDVLPASAVLSVVRPDPALADTVARSIEVHVLQGASVAFVRLLPANVDRSFAVYASLGTERRLLGHIAAAANEGTGPAMLFVHWTSADLQYREADHLTLVLVGDPAGLSETLAQRAYWAGEVTFADVPTEAANAYFNLVDASAAPTTRSYRVVPGLVSRPPGSPIMPVP